MQADDAITWTAIIQAYSIHGQGMEALQLFNSMRQHNVTPDKATLTCVLNGCSHSGLVEQAWDIYSTMEAKYCITPNEHHQTCIVDVWGRAGMLEQAEHFIKSMPHQPVLLWQTLLGACHNHKDIERVQNAASQILKLEPRDASTYVLLANTYATVGNWEESTRVWTSMVEQNIKKIPGMTWVTINGKTEVFYVDSNHPHKQEIVTYLAQTRENITTKLGYKPDTSCVLQPDLSEEERLHKLWAHSEKMALGWALLSKKGDIIMHKNLRVCNDCHTALKLISKLYERKFIIRDAHRFHHFDGGKCSCNDYW